MNILWIIVAVLLVAAFLGSPIGYWGSHAYGWYPSGGIGLLVIILVVLLLAGRL